jgi:hypothetical protein
MKTPTTRKQRLAYRQDELTALEVQIMHCQRNIASEHKRHRELAREYNNKLAFLGYLLED